MANRTVALLPPCTPGWVSSNRIAKIALLKFLREGMGNASPVGPLGEDRAWPWVPKGPRQSSKALELLHDGCLTKFYVLIRIAVSKTLRKNSMKDVYQYILSIISISIIYDIWWYMMIHVWIQVQHISMDYPWIAHGSPPECESRKWPSMVTETHGKMDGSGYSWCLFLVDLWHLWSLTYYII